MTAHRPFSSTLIWGPAAIFGLLMLLLYLQGAFATKVTPGTSENTTPDAHGPTAVVTREILPMNLRWPATVVSNTVARIAPKVPGRIEKISVDIGARVKRGQLLVQLDDQQIRAQLEAARAAVAAAQAQAARAAADAHRIHNLHAQGAATQQALDAALAAAKTSKAQVNQARHQFQALRAQLDETRIKAPFPGEIVERFADPGDMGLPGKLILTLQNPTQLRVETAIPQRCAQLLSIGDPLTVIEPGSGARLTAEVADMAAAADPLSHTTLVKVALPPDHALKPGAFAWAEQSCGEQETLLLPANAVRQVGQLEQVNQVIEGKAYIRLVRTGRRLNGRVEILSGLKPGDVVLLPGAAASGQGGS